MGESACLLRSFSHPSDASREVREGDPMRALTESISFGRYMLEPLAWEKWSTFSRNRHLEEVEKFAKPGSVAEKKAYFEAHYRKKAAMKESLQQADTEETNVTCVIQTPEYSSTIQTEVATIENIVGDCEQMEEDNPDVVIADSTDHSSVPYLTIEKSPSEIVETSGIEPAEQNPIEESSSQDEKLTGLDSLGGHPEGMAPQEEAEEENMPNKISSSSGEKRPVVSSSKLLTHNKKSKLLPPSHAKEMKSIQSRNGNSAVPSKEKSVLNLSEKKKMASKSLHMSINFASADVGASKAVSPVLKQIRKIKDITASLKLQRESLISRKTPTRASVGVNSKLTAVDVKSKVTSVTEKSEGRRTKSSLNKSVIGAVAAARSSSSLAKENSKPPNANTIKPQAPVVFSPFRFRSEERAAKRKEKQEEKKTSNAADEALINGRCKHSQTGSQSPKLRRKPSDSTVEGTKCRPPRQTSSNVNESSTQVKPRSNRSLRTSVMLLPRNNVRENASPNIQR